MPPCQPPCQRPRTKGSRSPCDHDRPVVAILPHHDRVAAQTDLVLLRAMGCIVKEPAAVAVPESLGGVVGIFFFISLGVMADMVAAPCEGRIFASPSHRQRGYRP